MMGRREGGQGQFFYAFDLDKVVPPDHLVRQIDSVIDLSWVYQELTPYYSDTGRPSIDPVLMIRMLIVGYVFAIRSERRICAEVGGEENKALDQHCADVGRIAPAGNAAQWPCEGPYLPLRGGGHQHCRVQHNPVLPGLSHPPSQAVRLRSFEPARLPRRKDRQAQNRAR